MSLFFLNKVQFYSLKQLNSVDQSPNLYDPGLFNEAVSVYFEISLIIRATRILLLICLLRYIFGLIRDRVTTQIIIRWILKLLFLWMCLYLSVIVVYSLPKGIPFLFHFVGFGWFTNLERAVQSEIFYQFHYLCGAITSCNLLDTISNCRAQYSIYLLTGDLGPLNLDALLVRLFITFIILLSHFTIVEWAWLTVMLIYMLPLFILLPSSVFIITWPDTDINYTVYMWKSLFFWVVCTMGMTKKWAADGALYTENNLHTEAKTSAIEWLLYLIDEFQHVLIY